MALYSVFALLAILHYSSVSAQCPEASPTVPIPGCWGTPGCAYRLAANEGLPPDTPDFCWCGGITVPLLTPTGASTYNCDYSTQPTANVPLGTKELPRLTTTQVAPSVTSTQAQVPPTKTALSSEPVPVPPGALIVTESVGESPLLITFVPTKATVPVTSTTTDSSGHTGIIIIPVGDFIWGIFGGKPPGLPTIPTPPGGIPPPPDPAKEPLDPTKPNNQPTPDKNPSPTKDPSPTSTTPDSSTSTSAAATCDAESVAVASDYPFVIGDDGEETPILSPDWIDSNIDTEAPPPKANPPAPTSQPPVRPSIPAPTPLIESVPPADPPGAPSCVPSPTGSFKDSHEDILMRVVQYFCEEYAQNHVTVDPTVRVAESIEGDSVEDLFIGSFIEVGDYEGGNKKARDDVYDITILSVDRCQPTDGFNLPEPVVGHRCNDVLYHAWKDCNNKGRGGTVMAGCLNYSIITKF